MSGARVAVNVPAAISNVDSFRRATTHSATIIVIQRKTMVSGAAGELGKAAAYVADVLVNAEDFVDHENDGLCLAVRRHCAIARKLAARGCDPYVSGDEAFTRRGDRLRRDGPHR